MVYYLRIICAMRWVSEKPKLFENIEGEAITTDLRCDGNEWSLYRVETDKLEQNIVERVAVKATALMLHRLKFPVTVIAFEESFIKSLGLEIINVPSIDEGEVGSWHCNAVGVCKHHIDAVATEIYTDLLNEQGLVFQFEKEDLIPLIAAYSKDFIGEGRKETIRNRKRTFQKVFNSFQSSPQYNELLSVFDKAIMDS